MSNEKLSKQQKNILGCIYTIQQDSKLDINSKFLIRKLYTVTTKGKEDPTRSESASFSRALAKLWERDLVKLYNAQRKKRVVSRMGVSLTETGLVIGKQFATEKKKKNLEKLLKSRFMRRLEMGAGFGDLTRMIKELTETVNRN